MSRDEATVGECESVGEHNVFDVEGDHVRVRLLKVHVREAQPVDDNVLDSIEQGSSYNDIGEACVLDEFDSVGDCKVFQQHQNAAVRAFTSQFHRDMGLNKKKRSVRIVYEGQKGEGRLTKPIWRVNVPTNC